MENQQYKMNLKQFEEFFWSYISSNIVSFSDRDNNSDWSDNIVYDAWRIYDKTEINESVIMKIIDNVIFAYDRYNPIFKK